MSEFTTPEEECSYNYTSGQNGIFCNATWDTIVCWGPVRAREVAKQPCPSIFGAGSDKYVYRKCGTDALWVEDEKWKGFGHSDYSECLGHMSSFIYHMFDFDHTPPMTISPEPSTSIMRPDIECMVLIAFSFVMLCLTTIGSSFKCFQNIQNETKGKMWRQLSCAILFETGVRLIMTFGHMYIPVLATKYSFCQFLIVSLEYADIAGMTWFLLIAHFLYVIESSKHVCVSGYMVYCVIGWALPVIPTTVWVVAIWVKSKNQCWINYEEYPMTWILQTTKILILVSTFALVFCVNKKISKKKPARTEVTNRVYRNKVDCAFCFYMVLLVLNILVKTCKYVLILSKKNDHYIWTISCVLNAGKGALLAVTLCVRRLKLISLLKKKKRKPTPREEIVPTAMLDENEL